MVKSEFLKNECSTLKMVCLIEQAPLSDKFEQIILTPEQYKGLTQYLWDLKYPGKEDGFWTSDTYKNISIPDIPDMYSVEDLESPLK